MDIKVKFDSEEDIKTSIDTGSIQYGQLEIGTTKTGEAGTQAVVTNSGSSSHAILNFTIPKGDRGEKGAKGEKGDTPDLTNYATKDYVEQELATVDLTDYAKKIDITTGAEVATNEYLDGERVYVKRVDCGYLNVGTASIPHNITNLKWPIRYRGVLQNESSGTMFNIPRSYPTDPGKYNVDCDITKTNINIAAGTNFNGALFKAYIEVYYTKN